MRLCVRLAVMAALLVALAVGLIWLRTDTAQAGNRLHGLFRQKRWIYQIGFFSFHSWTGDSFRHRT